MYDNVKRFTVELTFDADRTRFGDKLYVHLLVWDEIQQKNVLVTATSEDDVDLTTPGEGFVSLRIVRVQKPSNAQKLYRGFKGLLG